jgi:hypothetical protein
MNVNQTNDARVTVLAMMFAPSRVNTTPDGLGQCLIDGPIGSESDAAMLLGSISSITIAV